MDLPLFGIASVSTDGKYYYPHFLVVNGMLISVMYQYRQTDGANSNQPGWGKTS
jgi:hypothetical protein